MAGATRRPGDDNVVELVKRLSQQGTHLAQEQLNLVKAEMREAVADLKRSIVTLLAAAVLGISGLGVTLMGIAYLLGDAIDDRDLATLLVGVTVLIIALALFAAGRKKLAASNLKPARTIDTAERIPDAVTGNLNQPRASR
jgi:uncharacterized membrane protein YqjE